MYTGNISELEKLDDDEFEGVFLTTKEIANHYNVENFPNRRIWTAQNPIVLLPYSIYFPKHSCLER